MANSDPARRPPYRRRPLSQDDNDFHESLTAPIPTYRSALEVTDERPTAFEQTVRLIATLLALIILVRFITNLFSVDRSNGFVSLINAATDWIVRPFQAFIPQPAITSGGVFDWPAVIAAVLVAVVAAILVRFLRPARA